MLSGLTRTSRGRGELLYIEFKSFHHMKIVTSRERRCHLNFSLYVRADRFARHKSFNKAGSRILCKGNSA